MHQTIDVCSSFGAGWDNYAGIFQQLKTRLGSLFAAS